MIIMRKPIDTYFRVVCPSFFIVYIEPVIYKLGLHNNIVYTKSNINTLISHISI